jgi:hypothetical protein
MAITDLGFNGDGHYHHNVTSFKLVTHHMKKCAECRYSGTHKSILGQFKTDCKRTHKHDDGRKQCMIDKLRVTSGNCITQCSESELKSGFDGNFLYITFPNSRRNFDFL